MKEITITIHHATDRGAFNLLLALGDLIAKTQDPIREFALDGMYRIHSDNGGAECVITELEDIE